MKPLTEADIRGSFINIDMADALRVPVPGLHEMYWDDREYLGWRDPGAPQRGYLVAWHDDRPLGIVLRASETRLQVGSAICSLCHTTQPAGQVTMFTAARAGDAGKRGNSVGTYVCADLACSLLIRITPPQYAMQPAPEDVIADRAAGLRRRLDAFTGRVLRDAQ